MEKGRQEDRQEVARSMRDDGFPIEMIKKYTGRPRTKSSGFEETLIKSPK